METSLGEGFKNLFTESVRNGHGWQMGLYLETMVTDYGGAPSPQYKCCKIPTVSISISILKENKVGVETSYRFNAYDTIYYGKHVWGMLLLLFVILCKSGRKDSLVANIAIQMYKFDSNSNWGVVKM